MRCIHLAPRYEGPPGRKTKKASGRFSPNPAEAAALSAAGCGAPRRRQAAAQPAESQPGPRRTSPGKATHCLTLLELSGMEDGRACKDSADLDFNAEMIKIRYIYIYIYIQALCFCISTLN